MPLVALQLHHLAVLGVSTTVRCTQTPALTSKHAPPPT